MPVAQYVAEVMAILESSVHPRGEIILERDLARRFAERDRKFDAIFAAMNQA